MKTKNDQFLNLYNEVMEHFGCANKLASLLGISRHAIYQWEAGKYFPELRAYQIKELSKGKFTVEQLTRFNKKNRLKRGK